MRAITLIILFFISLIGNTQNRTGTWLGTYHRDQLQDRRVFYYRIHLQERNDSLIGVYEALDAQSDVNNIPVEDRKVVAVYKVYTSMINAHKDTNTFELVVSDPVRLDGNLVAASNIPPTFFKMICQVLPENEPSVNPVILYSSLPARDEATVRVKVKKISTERPDLSLYDMDNTIAWRISFSGLKKSFSFVRNKNRSKNGIDENAKSITPALTYHQRSQELQATLQVDSSTLSIALYDNGVVDNDTVSLYLNDEIILNQQRVTGNAIRLELKLEANKENKLTLFAHNLGEIAPNTAYMIVKNGAVEHKLFLSASLEKNVIVVFKVKPQQPAILDINGK